MGLVLVKEEIQVSNTLNSKQHLHMLRQCTTTVKLLKTLDMILASFHKTNIKPHLP